MSIVIAKDEGDSFDGLEDTYRRGSLTVGSDYMQIDGVDYEVSHVIPNEDIIRVDLSDFILLHR